MSDEKLRTVLHEEVVPYPTSLTAGTAVDYESDPYYDFEKSGLGSFDIINSVDVADYLTAGTVIVKPYVSFDEGDSWLRVGTVAGYQDFENTDDVAAVAEVTTGVISATGGDEVAEYDGRWFALYTGTTPTVFWFDATGSDTVPAHGLSGATAVKMDISSAGDTADGIGAAFVAVIDALGGWSASYTAGTNTFVITNATAGANTNVNTGNMLTATAVVDSLAATTQGADAIAGNVVYNNLVAIAPRVKVVASANASAAITAGHGMRTDIRMKEVDYGMRKKVFADVMTIPATTAPGFVINSDEMVTNADYMEQWKKAWVFTYCGDLSKVADTVVYILQASNDGTNWWNASAEGTDLANGSGILHSVTAVVHGTTYYLGKYLRVRLYNKTATDVTGALSASHGIQFNVIAEY